MSVLFLNIRSASNKIDELKSVLFDSDPCVVCLAEHWLHTDNIVLLDSMSEYKLVSQSSRKVSRGGGVAVLARRNGLATPYQLVDDMSVERCFEVLLSIYLATHLL
jgi:hypothetical protein